MYINRITITSHMSDKKPRASKREGVSKVVTRFSNCREQQRCSCFMTIHFQHQESETINVTRLTQLDLNSEFYQSYNVFYNPTASKIVEIQALLRKFRLFRRDKSFYAKIQKFSVCCNFKYIYVIFDKNLLALNSSGIDCNH